MRKSAVRWGRLFLTGLVLVIGLTGASRARAQDDRGEPWLGVYLQPLTEQLREGMDYRGTGGVLVSRVVPGSPADQAGIRNGDVIVRLNQRAVDSPAELQEMVRAFRVGQDVQVEVFRDGERRMLNVRLDERPGNDGTMRGEAPEAPEPPEAPMPPMPDMGRNPGMGGMGMMGMAARGRLGVRIESLSPDLGSYFGVPDGRGVLVLEVLDNTPAERAGLRAGDVITRVDQDRVSTTQDLVNALRGRTGRVQLRVLRHREWRTLDATLERQGPGRMDMYNSPDGSRRIIIRRNTTGQGAPAAPRMEPRGGSEDPAELRRQIDELRQQIDELQQQLDEEEQGGGGR